MIKIALVGKPNVGKSSLFNRLSKQRDAIVSEVSGTTRDIKQKEIEIDGKTALLIDTGGLEEKNELFNEVKKKALNIAKEADVVLFMVDGKEFPDDKDKKLFFQLQKSAKNIALVINKIDNDKMQENVYEYFSFGAKDIFDISVSHNRNISKLTLWLSSFIPEIVDNSNDEEDLLEFLEENYTDDGEKKEEENKIKVAILGRVNVGKSSLLNALSGYERSVVSHVEGTTIDPVDETIEYDEFEITFVDTAGIRKRSKIDGIEKYALQRSKKMLEEANVALLVLDASKDFVELDEKIGGLISDYKLATIIVLNKYDITQKSYKELEDDIRYRFKYLSYAPIITVSAKSKKRVHKIKDLIIEIYKKYTSRIPTSSLNEVILRATKEHQIPSDHGKIVKIYYATQFATKPPKIALISNRAKTIHFSYLRYLENRLRKNFDLFGTPIVLVPRQKGKD